jgi:hypothetical protein
MKRIAVESIQDGMILEKEVFGPSGSILLKKGTALSASMGARLKNWGVSLIHVQGEECSTSQAAPQTTDPQELRRHLELKFSHCLQSPAMKVIFAAVYQFKIKHHL